MSHLSVLVIGGEPEKQRDPYWELDLPDSEKRSDPRSEFVLETDFAGLSECLMDATERIILNNSSNCERWLRHLANGDVEQLMTDWNGTEVGVGGYGYWANPNAKWDWYSLGGRWTGFFRLKDGPDGTVAEGVTGRPGLMAEDAKPRHADQAIKMNIDWGATKIDGNVFAILKAGVWYEKGSMGWWGCVADEKEQGEHDSTVNEMLVSVGDDELISLHDCHI